METTPQYAVHLQWTEGSKGILSSPMLSSDLEVATAPFFSKGVEGVWSPEHLFVAAVNGSFMTTFLAVAEKAKLAFVTFDCHATGTVQQEQGRPWVSTIVLKPVLTILSAKEVAKALHVLSLTEKNCLISNSVSTVIHLAPAVQVA